VVLRGLPTVIDNQRFDAFMAKIKGSESKCSTPSMQIGIAMMDSKSCKIS